MNSIAMSHPQFCDISDENLQSVIREAASHEENIQSTAIDRVSHCSLTPNTGLSIIAQRDYEIKLRNKVKIKPHALRSDTFLHHSAEDRIVCLCQSTKDDDLILFCVWCETWQHQNCYYPRDELHPTVKLHDCVNCNPRYVTTFAIETICDSQSGTSISPFLYDLERANALKIWNDHVVKFKFGLDETQLETSDNTMPPKDMVVFDSSPFRPQWWGGATWSKLKSLAESDADQPAQPKLVFKGLQDFGLSKQMSSLQILHYYATQPTCGIGVDLINFFFENLLHVYTDPTVIAQSADHPKHINNLMLTSHLSSLPSALGPSSWRFGKPSPEASNLRESAGANSPAGESRGGSVNHRAWEL